MSHGQALRLGRAVGKTLTRLPADSRCLMQSLVLTGMSGRRNVDSTLVIGVHPGESFTAHAWVECDGLAILPTLEDEFVRFTEL